MVKSPIIICSGGGHTTQLFLDSVAKSIAEGRKEQDNVSIIRALCEPRPSHHNHCTSVSTECIKLLSLIPHLSKTLN